jgi:hypothetical protein
VGMDDHEIESPVVFGFEDEHQTMPVGWSLRITSSM